MSIEISAPEFGDAVGRLPDRCTPRDLFCRLLNPDENVHYLEAAFRLVVSLLGGGGESGGDDTAWAPLAAGSAGELPRALVERAAAELASPPAIAAHAASWPGRVARELAPAGLTDGAWLQGLLRAHLVETEVGMAAIKQYMMRFGDPGTRESHVQRYRSLLCSIGVPPASIARWERDDDAPCADLSYEHALLGLALGLFPIALRPETVGYNLWMATFGPCPLLDRVAGELREQGANLRYLDMYERGALGELGLLAAERLLAEDGGDAARARLTRGFAAAHRSYRRWEEAMLGRNVPMLARDFVLETIRRKAHFALGHHTRVRFGETRMEDLFRGGPAGHAALLDHLVADGLVVPGAPDRSPFITHSITFEGPMFEVFTASEQRDLREWIGSLGTAEPVRPRPQPVPLRGDYGAPQDPEQLRAWAMARYGRLSAGEQLYCGSNADQHPAVRLLARQALDGFLGKLAASFRDDPRLAATPPPRWSARVIAELVLERHRKNIESRPQLQAALGDCAPTPMNAPRPDKPSIAIAFDGVWLQGFADVHRSDREEYGWLFRIYASEQGDGLMEWNHNRIMRLAVSGAGEETMLPGTDRRLYEFCEVNPMNLILVAASLHTRHFMPELLGSNLGIEATGVGGGYLDAWRGLVAKTDNHWAALSYRLHNSIDNYVTGHTKWSLAAIQSFMARVEDSAPAAVEEQWQRIWRVWRLQEILEHGTPDERQALREAMGFDVSSLAPIPAALSTAETGAAGINA
jgi:hypothetical protein